MENKKKENRKITLYAIVIILAIASITFRLLNKWELEQTSLLFIGVPALITIYVIKYTNRPKTSYAIMFYVISIFLLLCGVLLGEGFICIIIMAPLFYGVGALIVVVSNHLKSRKKENLNAYILAPLLLLIAQFYEINNSPEIQKITTTILLEGDIQLSQLSITPDFQENLPSFFKIGFPKPIGVQGQGIEVGDIRNIKFLSNTKGIGTLILKIKEATDSKIIFEIVSDNTHIAHWLSYKEVSVALKRKGENTEITWITDFTCDLGPSWYFEPIEKVAINLMNEHLLNSYFEK